MELPCSKGTPGGPAPPGSEPLMLRSRYDVETSLAAGMSLHFASTTFVVTVLGASAAFAQTAVEVGGQLGVACQQGREKCAGTFVGPTAGVQLKDRLDLRFRFFSFTIGDRTIATNDVLIHETSVNRRMILGEVVYNFMPRQRVRPFLGLSVGQRRDKSTVNCSPRPCAEVAAILGPSQFHDGSPVAHCSVGVIAGLNYRVANRVRIQGLVGLHDFPREEGRTIEGSFGVVLRLWKRQ